MQLWIPCFFLVVAVLLVPSFRLSAGRLVGRDQPDVPSLRSSLIGAVALVGFVALAVNVPDGDIHTHLVRAMGIATIAPSVVAIHGLSGPVSPTPEHFCGGGGFITGNPLR